MEVSYADFTFTHGGHQYEAITTANKSWIDAATDAASRQFSGVNGQLARIDDAAENTAIFNALLANISPVNFSNTVAPDGGGGAYVWIGASDRVNEGQWLWDGDGNGTGDQFWNGDKTGTAVGGLYNNWGAFANQNEPDDFFNNQDAAGISLNGWPLGNATQWNDVNQSNQLYYLVEFAVPEPSSLLLTGLGMSFLAIRRQR